MLHGHVTCILCVKINQDFHYCLVVLGIQHLSDRNSLIIQVGGQLKNCNISFGYMKIHKFVKRDEDKYNLESLLLAKSSPLLYD